MFHCRMRTCVSHTAEKATKLHDISFDLSMDHNLDLANISTCTTCRFKEDKSNYWTATLYFKHPNGSFIRVSSPFSPDSSRHVLHIP